THLPLEPTLRSTGVVHTLRRRPRCGLALVPRALQPYGLGQRLTVLERLRGVVAVRLDHMPHRLRLIRKPLAATGETHQPESGGPLPLGGHRGRWHLASSAWRNGTAQRTDAWALPSVVKRCSGPFRPVGEVRSIADISAQ